MTTLLRAEVPCQGVFSLQQHTSRPPEPVRVPPRGRLLRPTNNAFDPIAYTQFIMPHVISPGGCRLADPGSGCGTADTLLKFKDPPLVPATLHTVTLSSDSSATAGLIERAGYTAVALPPNYQQADMVEASLWGVPEPVAAKAVHFRASRAAPGLRLLVLPLAAKGREPDAELDQAFFRNVLASEVPAWPLPGAQPANVRVQVWTYLVPDILVASKRLRENGIPVIFDPVHITTAYMGDQKTLAIRAPDGTVVQLVQSVAQ